MAAGLTEKQKRFCEEYLIDLNATRAYMAAYPRVKNENTAAACASENLRKPKVKEYLDERKKDRKKRTEITQDRVLRELATIAFTNATEIVSYDRGGHVRIKATEDLGKDEKKIIAGIKEGQWGTEVKFHDRLRALELLMKHLGMFDQKDELDKEEQKARIEKLKNDARIVEEGEESGVILMPAIEEVQPPDE